MSDPFIEELQATKNLEKKASLLADSLLKMLPENTAFAAQSCILLHWFDQTILNAFLQNAPLVSDTSSGDAAEIFEQLVSLPFIERFAKGAAFNDTTRKGLLKLYARSQPDVLINAAKMMAPLYEAREAYGPDATEAFFCYLVSNNTEAATALLDKLLDEAICREDWHYITGILQLYDEAQQLPFVHTFPLSERQWVLRGLAHRAQGELRLAADDYQQAIVCNPSNGLTHMVLGALYVGQEHYEEALQEYERVIELDPRHVQAYNNKGIVHFRQGQYNKALSCFEKSLQIDHNNSDAKRYRQRTLARIVSTDSLALAEQQEASSISRRYLSSLRVPKLRAIIKGEIIGFAIASIAANIVTHWGNVFPVFWSLVVQIWSLVVTSAITSIWPTLIALITLLIGFVWALEKKPVDERENDLWETSQREINDDISPERLEIVKRSQRQNTKKGVVRLAQIHSA